MKRKYVMTTGIMALMLAMATGCGNGQETESRSSMLSSEDAADESVRQLSQNDEAGSDTPESPMPDEGKDDDCGTPDISSENDSNSQDTIFIGGKVRSITQDGFVISRTLVEDSMVVMPEAGSPEEELVSVRYTDSTTFERWTIQGGGADIVMEEAASPDIREGTGLEAKGYFDGEEFVAEKVIIEIYN